MPAGTSRILVLAEVFPPRRGGSGRWLWELYRRLADSTVVLAGESADAAAFDRDAELTIHRTRLAFPTWGVLSPAGASAYFQAFREAARLARSAGVTTIHAGKALPEGLLARLVGARLGLPYWCFAHGEELTLAEGSRELRWLTRRVLRSATGIVANSRNTKTILEERWGVAPARAFALGPGVDTARFTPAPPDPEFRDRLGWSGRRVVLTVGALQKRKGQDTMIRALARIRERYPDVLYALAGEGWERQYLEDLVAEHRVADLVQFLGTPAEDELVRLYQQCDLFALPNRQIGWDFEGFGIVLLEAQACGRPVITGASGGTGEAMLPGETGMRLPCEEPAPLAEAVIQLLEDADRRQAFGSRGRSWVVDHFDWSVRAAEAARLFTDSAAASRG